MRARGILGVGAVLACCALLHAGAAAAQGMRGPPNALQGFSQNRNEPIKIESVSLEVRDKEKIATFFDNVRLVQGDTVLECKKLIVYYEDEVSPVGAAPRQQGASPGNQQIKRLEAKGGVIVTQKDQTAVGDDGVYDMVGNSITLIGNVIVTQGQNVIKGDRLWVDLASGVSRVEAGRGAGGRVQGVFLPSQLPAETRPSPPTGRSAVPAPQPRPGRAPHNSAERERARPASPQPLRLN